ncbi:MAG TPA: MFS transporter [Flavobacteriales bacterium]|nr:MFS transporter [Flavobacteriales bacterium]HQX29606.1 MFS transporter [Flavobacteriales bacterium]HQX38142.1 MFS transporter [Flavobacteriales bacterium]HQZ43037.1 MFS transporter [Flavobacteriales bacterium]HQZ92006.1 MFS transporter [Flavobacteriales bacterium]
MQFFSRAYHYYIHSFEGLRREVWMLAAVTFVNRAGTMVVPFLSLYLTKDMGLSMEQVGWIMSCFGLGSVLGSWLGGKLTDRFGFYDVMIGALVASGIAFILLQFVQGFVPFCFGIFALTLVSDTFRPAIFVALRAYAKPENRTRAVTLIRLAINLGFSLGPAIGGLIIAGLGYSGLFWVDGITCLVAVGIMLYWLPRKQAQQNDQATRSTATRSPYSDGPYWLFLLTMVLISVPFLQYFSTIPLFYSEVHNLSETYIGVLLGLNGLLIFLIEMPLIKFCEDRKFDLYRILLISVVLFALSFAVLNWFPVIGFLWVGMTLMTVGEMLNFPFMNRFAYDRSDQGPPGAYMALFTMSWSVAHIFGHTLGLNLIAQFGYTSTWYIMAGIMVLAMGLLVVLKRMMESELTN